MRNRSQLTYGLAAAIIVATAVTATPTFAKDATAAIDGYKYYLPEGSENNLEAVRALIAASDGLGMTRRSRGQIPNGNNQNCLGCSTASYEYKGSGTYAGQKADVMSIHFDYRIPAVRTDVTFADGTRMVTVAANGLTWDESIPGVFAKDSDAAAADRLLEVYLLPPAVVFFGQAAADKIKLSMDGADRVLTVPLPDLDADLKATLDFNGRPVHTEISYGGKVYTGDYSDFSNDHMDYHVWGPNHVVQKVDGKVMTDLQLDYHWTNPYMVFPTPQELAQK